MRNIILFILFLFFSASSSRAQTSVKADKTRSTITYFMKHAVHAWSGTSKDVSCIIQLNSSGEVEKVAATAKVKSFDSQNSNRDSHMLEVTDALTYPNVSFYSTAVSRNPDGYSVKGILNFHGVEKPVDIQVRESASGKQRVFAGSFIFLLEDHKVERPTLFMIKTDNEVKIEFSFVF